MREAKLRARPGQGSCGDSGANLRVVVGELKALVRLGFHDREEGDLQKSDHCRKFVELNEHTKGLNGRHSPMHGDPWREAIDELLVRFVRDLVRPT